MDKVTICIPTYNSIKYLKKNYEHIRGQSKSVKILYWDDCSIDGTKNLLKDIAKYDENVSVFFNEKNKGQAYCRNMMMKKCNTKYLWFCDDDVIYISNFDFINIQENIDIYYMDFFNGIRKYNSHFYDNFLIFLRKTIRNEKLLYINKKISNSNNVFRLFGYSSCNKIFRLEFLLENNLRFNDKYRFEDFIINYWMSLAKKIFYTKFVYYNIIGHQNSTTRNKNGISSMWMDQCKTIIHTLKLSKNSIFFNFIVEHAIIPFYCMYFYYLYFDKENDFRLMAKEFNNLTQRKIFLFNDNKIKISNDYVDDTAKNEIKVYKNRFI